jgi:hypothetical protein
MVKRKNYIKRPTTGKSKHIRQPITPVGVSCLDESPIFSIQCNTPRFCFNDCIKTDQLLFIDKIHMLSRLTWKQIQSAPRKGNGYEKIARKSIKAPIPDYVTRDVEFFLSFRISGGSRMVGHRINRLFEVLWIGKGIYVH